MALRNIYITDNDAKRLRQLLRLQLVRNHKDRENLRILEAELRRGTIVKPNDVRPDVVTMHSRVVVEFGRNAETMECTLVFPEEADSATGRISVVAPIGAALLGYRVGDRIRCSTPGGVQTLRIKEILFQPEAVGVYSTG
jgi:regulator of nucleoside diphosphate kinase